MKKYNKYLKFLFQRSNTMDQLVARKFSWSILKAKYLVGIIFY